jgi:hypothetical protein
MYAYGSGARPVGARVVKSHAHGMVSPISSGRCPLISLLISHLAPRLRSAIARNAANAPSGITPSSTVTLGSGVAAGGNGTAQDR